MLKNFCFIVRFQSGQVGHSALRARPGRVDVGYGPQPGLAECQKVTGRPPFCRPVHIPGDHKLYIVSYLSGSLATSADPKVPRSSAHGACFFFGRQGLGFVPSAPPPRFAIGFWSSKKFSPHKIMRIVSSPLKMGKSGKKFEKVEFKMHK